MDTHLSLIIPVYNAEIFIIDTLIRLTEWKQKINYSVQIILVNDGSRDSTNSQIEDYIRTKDSSIELISYEMNQGKGFAVRKGMLTSSGKYKIFTDADIPFGLEIINKIEYYLNFKEFDICIGNRKSRQSEYFEKMSWMRKCSSQLFTAIISRFIVSGISDTQCGLKGFNADVANFLFSDLKTKGFAFDVELLYLCYKYEFDVKRIPVEFEGNYFSTIKLARNAIQMICDIIYIPFHYHFSKKR